MLQSIDAYSFFQKTSRDRNATLLTLGSHSTKAQIISLPRQYIYIHALFPHP